MDAFFFMNKQTKNIYKLFLKSTGVFTDTRKPLVGGVFIALRGPTFNGNTYASKAIQQGACLAIIDDYQLSKKNEKFIYVEDCYIMLKILANHHRKKMTCPVLAITGSNGKTTTKELLKIVIKQGYKTHATHGNLNNHIGVPLTILNTPLSSEFVIIEMGANHLKEIKGLCEVAEPTHGFITNFGKAHIEGFGSEKGVIEGKSELYTYLSKSKGTVFVNTDNVNQVEKLGENPFISFGQSESSNYSISYRTKNNKLELGFKGDKINSSLHGEYNFPNIAAAIAIGSFFKIPTNKIRKAIKSYESSNNRSQLIKLKNYEIILDAYNANPSSMGLAIKSFKSRYLSDNIIILGDMLELGEYALISHQEIISLAIKSSFSKIITVGKHFKETGMIFSNLLQFSSTISLIEYLNNNPIKEKNILIKGSRSMELERVLAFLEEKV